jgi:hypothetical protein
MATLRPLSYLAIVAVAGSAFALAQTRVNGVVGPCAAVAPADVVAEARAGLAHFPFEVGRGAVGADGSFALQFRDEMVVPTDVTMAVAQLFDADTCATLSISDPMARVVVVRDLRVIPRGGSCEWCETLGTLYAATRARGSLSTTGDVEVRWIYADRAVTVEGLFRHGWGAETYDLALEPGWNTVVVETVDVRGGLGYWDVHDVLVAVQPFPTATVAWRFESAR